jgi:hypothetical protein
MMFVNRGNTIATNIGSMPCAIGQRLARPDCRLVAGSHCLLSVNRLRSSEHDGRSYFSVENSGHIARHFSASGRKSLGPISWHSA